MGEITHYFKPSELASLPNIDSQKVLLYTHIRIHQVHILKVAAFFDGIGIAKYLVSSEDDATRSHVHCILQGQEYAGRDKKGMEFRKKLTAEFKIKGNKAYSISPVRDGDKAISYILKEGEYINKGFDEEFVKVRQQVSYKKYSKEAIAKEMEENNKNYIVGTINDKEWVRRYVQIKHSYNQFNVNLNRTKDLLLNLRLKKDPRVLEEFVSMLTAYPEF